jgi:hypothetical protein
MNLIEEIEVNNSRSFEQLELYRIVEGDLLKNNYFTSLMMYIFRS